MVDDHPFACPSIDFRSELKWSKYFVLSDLASYFVVFGYQVDAVETAVFKVRRIFLKLWSYGAGMFTLIWMGNQNIWKLSK